MGSVFLSVWCPRSGHLSIRLKLQFLVKLEFLRRPDMTTLMSSVRLLLQFNLLVSGGAIYTAANDTVESTEALENPFDFRVTGIVPRCSSYAFGWIWVKGFLRVYLGEVFPIVLCALLAKSRTYLISGSQIFGDIFNNIQISKYAGIQELFDSTKSYSQI